jgi:hypothetical protein
MHWEAITAIAEVLAAVGIIASLLYLAAEVRQRNRASAVAAKLASTQLLVDFVDSLIADPQLMDVFLRGRKDIETLSANDRFRFANMCLKRSGSSRPLSFNCASELCRTTIGWSSIQ